MVSKNVARKLFHFGARSEKISSQNEKNPAPLYSIKSNRNRSVLGSYSETVVHKHQENSIDVESRCLNIESVRSVKRNTLSSKIQIYIGLLLLLLQSGFDKSYGEQIA